LTKIKVLHGPLAFLCIKKAMQTISTPEVLYNRHTGDTLSIIKDSTSTSGKLLEMEAVYQPASAFAPEHFHPMQEEYFIVLSGRLLTKINGTIREYRAGESFTVPAGTPHAMYNAGAEQVHFRWQIYPALRSEDFFRTIYQSTTKKKGKPSLADTLFLLKEFRHEFVVTKIPVFLQPFIFRFILPLLGKIK
jgi:quercetin dioxygenase-like cupin family protein